MKFLIFLFILFETYKTEVQILDYTNSQLISMHQGQARLQNGNFKLIHILELDEYERTINNLNNEVQRRVLVNSTSLPFLLHDIEQIRNQIKRMKPRIKRSIDIIGTAWKWIAGTPDHEDHNIVVSKINGLLTNNERQKIINEKFIDRINLLTNTTNHILKTIQTLEETQRVIEDSIRNRINIVKADVINIEYALQWAKVGVINSFILSEKEINEAKQFLDLEEFPYNNLEEALGFATVKIATDYSSLIYIINLPAINKINCEKILIKPVKQNQKIIKINSENLIRCKDKIFEMKNKCNQFNDLCICNNEKLIDISETTCIPLLLKSKNHNCTFINNEHVPTIQEINEGTILLNQFNGFLEIFENKIYQLSGTYLIQFHNETIKIENRTFTSKEVSHLKALPAVLQLSSNKSIVEEVLSLEMMKNIQVNNIDEINSISTKGRLMFSTNISLSILLVIAICLIFIKLKSKSNSDINITAKIEKEKEQNTSTVEKSNFEKSNKRFCSANELPTF